MNLHVSENIIIIYNYKNDRNFNSKIVRSFIISIISKIVKMIQ